MKTMAWRWTLAASAMALFFAACTVTSDDPNDDDGGTAGTGGGTAGTGGGTAGTGGGTAGTGGGTAGTGGGSAGAAGAGSPCDNLETDACSQCVKTNCCTEFEGCVADADQFCMTALACMGTCDAGDPMTCAQTCDDGNFNEPFNNLITCMTNSCPTECAAE